MSGKPMNKMALATRILVAPLFAIAAGAPAFAVVSTAAPVASTTTHSKAQSPVGDEVWGALDKSAWIVEGNPKATQVVYIFTDTECKYCRQLWHDMQPYLARGKLQSRHVMVAVISEDSAGRGAAVMDSAHPAAALKDNENSKLPRLAPELAIPRSTLKSLNDNAQLMHRLGAQGTPVIVYQDDTGKSIVVQGIPPAERLAKIFGPAKAK